MGQVRQRGVGQHRRMATTRERGYAGAWPRVRRAILLRDRYRCWVCGGRAGEVDHVVPVSAGGARLDPRNLRAVCKRCNVRRAREREEHLGFPNRPSWSKPGHGGVRRVWSGAVSLEP
jgi:5-methylcytosine-specific restriction endonuclease McrA